jgi:hypothetical protein
VAVLLGLGAYLAVHLTSGGGPAPGCFVRTEGGERYDLDPDQAANAATVSAVAAARRLPQRAVTIALATALQESRLHNISHGDRDSLGLFQQRPSQGWGTARQIQDPVYAAGKFYDHLVRVPGYSRLPLTVAAQEVQRSGYPQAYAKHEAGAELLAAALTGRAPASLTCTTAKGTQDKGDPVRVRRALAREFGKAVPGGPAAGGARTLAAAGGPATGGAHGVVIVPLAADGTGKAPRRGWQLAHWAVAKAGELRLREVAFGGRVWKADDGSAGWRKDSSASAGEVRIVAEQ